MTKFVIVQSTNSANHKVIDVHGMYVCMSSSVDLADTRKWQTESNYMPNLTTNVNDTNVHQRTYSLLPNVMFLFTT